MKALLTVVVAGLLFSCFAVAQEAEVVDALDENKLNELLNSEAVVRGVVLDVGKTKDGGITFLNFSHAKKQGFVAVVFRRSYGQFPDGLEQYKGKTVEVSGRITEFRQQPQIVLESAEQLKVVE